MQRVNAADGTELWFDTHGDPANPALFLGPHFYASFSPMPGEDWTAPWIDGLKDDFFLIVADYPRGMGRTGNPQGLDFDPEVAVEEYRHIASAAGVERFGWIGYSYGGAMGVQLACRSDLITALAVGGFPPLNAPFREMVDICTRAAEGAVAGGHDPKLAWSSVGFYTPMLDWPERDEIARLDIPRLAFMGSDDVGMPGMGVDVPLAGRLREAEEDLASLGWRIAWLDHADHLAGVRADIALAPVRAFLRDALK